MTRSGASRPGGRTARNREAVYGAVLAELATRSYDQVSVETIAQRAQVHKTTVYRRWGTKDELVAEALATVAASRIEVPDTGDVEVDLQALAGAVRATLTSTVGAATVRALVCGSRDSPDLAGVTRRFWAGRLDAAAPIVQRAVDRGQLPRGTDAHAVLTFLAAPLYYRLLVTAEPLMEDAADLSAAATLAAARAGAFVVKD